MKDLFKKKIPVYFYCILGLLFWTNPILAQKTITLNLNNQKIAAVIERIESNTDYTFFYNSQLIDTNKRVTVKVNNASIEQVLDQMFKN
ncbi:MAG: STN domain-containing protein, partial [Bacteroides sp.]